MYNIIDLFCGCGGFSQGFQNIGFHIALGIDNWKDATITFQHNHKGAAVINKDITMVSAEELLNAAKLIIIFELVKEKCIFFCKIILFGKYYLIGSGIHRSV